MIPYHGGAFGATQTGKTTSILRMAKHQKGRVIFINSKRDLQWSKFFHFPYVSSLEELEIIYDNPNSKDAWIQIVPTRAMIKDLKTNLGDHYDEIFMFLLAEHLENPKLPDTTLIIDEIQNFQSNRSCNEALKRVWTTGEGAGLHGWFTAQDPTMVHRHLTVNSQFWIIHRITTDGIERLTDRGVLDSKDIDSFEWKRKHTCYVKKHSGDKWRTYF